MLDLIEARLQWAELSERDDWNSKGKLLNEISRIGTPGAERFIVEILNNQSGEYAWVRGIAAACLFTAREESSIDALVRNMKYFITMDSGGDYSEENEFVRAACTEALGENAKWRRENGVPPLGKKYEEKATNAIRFALDDKVEVCAKAVVALGKFGHTEERVAAIYDAYKKKLAPDFITLAESFFEMGLAETHAIKVYMEALNSEDPKIVEKMVKILEKIIDAKPDVDKGGRIRKQVDIRKRMLLAQGKDASESIVDTLLKVRFSAPHLKGTTSPRLPAQKLKPT